MTRFRWESSIKHEMDTYEDLDPNLQKGALTKQKLGADKETFKKLVEEMV